MIKIYYCKACGKHLDFENAEICPSCKTNLKKSYRYYFDYCPNCGKKLDLSDNQAIEICPQCGVRIIEKTEFSLTEFVSENSGLFVTSSIFIALAVYLSGFGQSINTTHFIVSTKTLTINIFEVAIGASIFLSILISSLIIKKMIIKFFQFRFSRTRNYLFSFAGVKVTVFLSLFCLLLGGLFLYFYSMYKIVFLIFLFVIAYSLAPYSLYVLYKIFDFDMNAPDFQGRKKVIYLIVLCICGSVIYFTSDYFMHHSSDNPIINLLFPFLGISLLITSFMIFIDLFILLISALYDVVKILHKKIKNLQSKQNP